MNAFIDFPRLRVGLEQRLFAFFDLSMWLTLRRKSGVDTPLEC